MNKQTATLHEAANHARAARTLLQEAHANATGLASLHLFTLLSLAGDLSNRTEQATEASRAEPADHKETAYEAYDRLLNEARAHDADAERFRDEARTRINGTRRKTELLSFAKMRAADANTARADADAIQEALATLHAHENPETYRKDTGEDAPDAAAAERARHTLARHGLTA